MSRLFAGLLMAGLITAANAGAEQPLSLAAAERLALERDSAARRLDARAEALRAEAVAAEQWPDPKVRFGVENLPTRDLALDSEPMTQVSVGLVQEFPRGDSRSLRAQQGLALAAGEEARARERRLQTLRATRRAWLDVWFQAQALDAVRAARELFQRSLAVTEDQYASGRENQQAMLQARVELARMADRESATLGALETARAELARWIGEEARLTLPRDGLALPEAESLAALEQRLPSHPALEVEGAEIVSAETETRLAQQEYRPAFALDLSYGKRFGEENGAARSDMVTAMIEVELPLFPGRRQDQRVVAARRNADAARFARDDRLRELRAQLDAAWANWNRLGERLDAYRRDLLPQSELNATAADHAYRNRTGSFDLLVRARIADLDARLEALRLEADRAQLQADLAWFSGVTP